MAARHENPAGGAVGMCFKSTPTCFLISVRRIGMHVDVHTGRRFQRNRNTWSAAGTATDALPPVERASWRRTAGDGVQPGTGSRHPLAI